MKSDIIYQDKLVDISNDSILLKNYYFPSLKPKEISFNSIDKVKVKKPSIWTGKWRFHGTGDIRTWFPLDNARNKRDKIFFITLKHKLIRIGFTVEDSGTVQKIFREKGLLN
jgi:hypothetical protein